MNGRQNTNTECPGHLAGGMRNADWGRLVHLLYRGCPWASWGTRVCLMNQGGDDRSLGGCNFCTTKCPSGYCGYPTPIQLLSLRDACRHRRVLSRTSHTRHFKPDFKRSTYWKGRPFNTHTKSFHRVLGEANHVAFGILLLYSANLPFSG